MKKYSFLIIAVICVCMFLAMPSAVNAEEPPEIIKLIGVLWGPDFYYEEENGNIFDNTEKYGVKYNKETNTLTLNNYKGEAIYHANMGDDFKVEILGENVIYPAVDADSTFACISGSSNVEFIGDGKLTLDPSIVSSGANDFTKYPLEREILISGGDIVINGPEITILSELSPIEANNFNVKKGVLNITIDGYETGLSVNKEVNISGGNVKIKTGSLGICSGADINITGGNIDIQAGDLVMAPNGKINIGKNMGITNLNLAVYEFEFGDSKVQRIVDESIKEFADKVNIVEYKYDNESQNQPIDIEKGGTLTLKINADYEAFKNGGKVFIDEKEISSDKYTSKAGSTIITLNEDYVKTLENGEHEITVEFGNGAQVATNFTVINNKEIDEEEITTPEINKGEDKEDVSVPNEGESESIPSIKDEETDKETKPEEKPGIKDEVTDKVPGTEVKDETPNTGRQEVNVQAIVAVVMLCVVGAVVVSKKRA